MEVAKRLICKDDPSLLVDEVTVVDPFHEDPVFRLRFGKLPGPFLHLPLQVFRVSPYLLLVEGLEVVAEPGDRVEETLVQPFHGVREFFPAKLPENDGGEDRPVELVCVLDLGEGEAAIQAEPGDPFDVGVYQGIVVVDKDRTARLVCL